MKDPLDIYAILSEVSIKSQPNFLDYRFQISALQVEAKRLGFNFVKTDKEHASNAISPELEYSLTRAIKYSRMNKNSPRKEWMLTDHLEQRNDSSLILYFILNSLSTLGIQLIQDPKAASLIEREVFLHKNRYLVDFKYCN